MLNHPQQHYALMGRLRSVGGLAVLVTFVPAAHPEWVGLEPAASAWLFGAGSVALVVCELARWLVRRYVPCRCPYCRHGKADFGYKEASDTGGSRGQWEVWYRCRQCGLSYLLCELEKDESPRDPSPQE